MENKFFDKEKFEVYSTIEIGLPCFVRLDGWNFHSLTKKLRSKKPFDKKFTSSLVNVAESFFVPFNPTLCFLFSDEISFLFTKPMAFKRIEKIDSVFAGLFSSQFSLLTKQPASFDCRVVPIKDHILPYLVWRQKECYRNHNNAWAQLVLQKEGLKSKQIDKKLRGLKTKDLFELCRKHKTDISKTPIWQRNGVLLYWDTYKKEGYNPIQKRKVIVERRRVKVDWDPLKFDSNEGKKLIENLVRCF